MMEERTDVWTDTDSRDFLDLAEVAVPGRQEQVEMLLQLVPATKDEDFRAVELACGEGLLAERLLDRFPPRERSEELTGSLDTYKRLAAEGWGPPETDEPEPGEMPARLSDHLTWLKEAGFKDVDCFWMRGGIAIYGGYR